MAAVPSGELIPINASVSTQSEQNIVNQAMLDNLEIVNQEGLNARQISALNIARFNATGFAITKQKGLIQYVGFDSVGAISGTLPLAADLDIGTTFYLFNESAIPATDTITIALGSHSIINSAATSIILNSSTFITCLTYVAVNTFVAYKMETI